MTSYIVICIVSLLVSALTLFSGFGLGTLLMPAFAVFFPIEIAIAATALVHLANNVFKVFLVGRMADRATTLKFALPAALAAMAGAYLLAQLGEVQPLASYSLGGRVHRIEPIKLAIGSLITVFSLFEMVPRFQRISVSSKYIPLGGLLSGFFGGLSGLQGALRSMFLIRAGLNKDQFIGTGVLSAVIVDVSRLAVYGTAIWSHQLGQLKQEGLLGLIIAGTVAAFVGSFTGTRLLKKVTLNTIQKIVGGLLLVVGVGLIAGLI